MVLQSKHPWVKNDCLMVSSGMVVTTPLSTRNEVVVIAILSDRQQVKDDTIDISLEDKSWFLCSVEDEDILLLRTHRQRVKDDCLPASTEAVATASLSHRNEVVTSATLSHRHMAMGNVSRTSSEDEATAPLTSLKDGAATALLFGRQMVKDNGLQASLGCAAITQLFPNQLVKDDSILALSG